MQMDLHQENIDISYRPRFPLPDELLALDRMETVCQYCGVSYLILSEFKDLEKTKRLQFIDLLTEVRDLKRLAHSHASDAKSLNLQREMQPFICYANKLLLETGQQMRNLKANFLQAKEKADKMAKAHKAELSCRTAEAAQLKEKIAKHSRQLAELQGLLDAKEKGDRGLLVAQLKKTLTMLQETRQLCSTISLQHAQIRQEIKSESQRIAGVTERLSFSASQRFLNNPIVFNRNPFSSSMHFRVRTTSSGLGLVKLQIAQYLDFFMVSHPPFLYSAYLQKLLAYEKARTNALLRQAEELSKQIKDLKADSQKQKVPTAETDDYVIHLTASLAEVRQELENKTAEFLQLKANCETLKGILSWQWTFFLALFTHLVLAFMLWWWWARCLQSKLIKILNVPVN
ncbi:unnamed protein product [Dibothriocephalus latus]|uniref:Uncharacterized protein n=1 Tax=Dibothriocephalus latus TaxID=60516 RepID=A0A3P6TP34_DIBLA|nr:unnamed protein product [Dibothriocephalus latus]